MGNGVGRDGVRLADACLRRAGRRGRARGIRPVTGRLDAADVSRAGAARPAAPGNAASRWGRSRRQSGGARAGGGPQRHHRAAALAATARPAGRARRLGRQRRVGHADRNRYRHRAGRQDRGRPAGRPRRGLPPAPRHQAVSERHAHQLAAGRGRPRPVRRRQGHRGRLLRQPLGRHRPGRGEGGGARRLPVPFRDPECQQRTAAGRVRGGVLRVRAGRPDAAADAGHRVRPVRVERRHQRVLRPLARADDRLDRRLRHHRAIADRPVPDHLHDRGLVGHLHRRIDRVRRRPDVGRGLRGLKPAAPRWLDDVRVLAVHQRRDRARGGHPGRHRP